MGQQLYQQVLKPPPQQPALPPYMRGTPPINGPIGNLMPHQYYQSQPVNQQLPFLATLDLTDLS